MTSGDTATSENIVDEASDVEKRLEHIRKLIMSAEAKEAAKGIDGSKQNPVSQEEKIEGDSNGASEVSMYILFWVDNVGYVQRPTHAREFLLHVKMASFCRHFTLLLLLLLHI